MLHRGRSIQYLEHIPGVAGNAALLFDLYSAEDMYNETLLQGGRFVLAKAID